MRARRPGHPWQLTDLQTCHGLEHLLVFTSPADKRLERIEGFTSCVSSLKQALLLAVHVLVEDIRSVERVEEEAVDHVDSSYR